MNITVPGETGEGDGIDSNGWLVINGGTVTTAACGFSADAGIDSDMGIHINGGTVLATGNMLDQIAESKQTYAVFQFAQPQTGGSLYQLRNSSGAVVAEYAPANDFSCMIVSSDPLIPGEYSLWCGDTQLSVTTGGMGGFHPGGFGGGMMPPPDGAQPEMSAFQPNGRPEDLPEFSPENPPEGMPPQSQPGGFQGYPEESLSGGTLVFRIQTGSNMFLVLGPVTE